MQTPRTYEDFDQYLETHNVKPGDEHNAFAEWFHVATGWDGDVEKASDGDPFAPTSLGRCSDYPSQIIEPVGALS